MSLGGRSKVFQPVVRPYVVRRRRRGCVLVYSFTGPDTTLFTGAETDAEWTVIGQDYPDAYLSIVSNQLWEIENTPFGSIAKPSNEKAPRAERRAT